MQTYTVYEPPNPPADRVDRAESLVFVKDGFSWLAALFAPLWMLAHRLWWPLLGYIVANIALQAVQWLTGVSPDLWVLTGLALNLLVGFEAGTLRAWTLERRQWRNLGAVSGRSLEECERRFLDAWLPSQPIIAPATGSGRLGGLLTARG